MADISELPRLHDIDADYSVQYAKLARVLRGRIGSGKYCQGNILPAADLGHEYYVSIRVTYDALAMPAADRYLSRRGSLTSYRLIWQVGT